MHISCSLQDARPCCAALCSCVFAGWLRAHGSAPAAPPHPAVASCAGLARLLPSLPGSGHGRLVRLAAHHLCNVLEVLSHTYHARAGAAAGWRPLKPRHVRSSSITSWTSSDCHTRAMHLAHAVQTLPARPLRRHVVVLRRHNAGNRHHQGARPCTFARTQRWRGGKQQRLPRHDNGSVCRPATRRCAGGDALIRAGAIASSWM